MAVLMIAWGVILAVKNRNKNDGKEIVIKSDN